MVEVNASCKAICRNWWVVPSAIPDSKKDIVENTIIRVVNDSEFELSEVIVEDYYFIYGVHNIDLLENGQLDTWVKNEIESSSEIDYELNSRHGGACDVDLDEIISDVERAIESLRERKAFDDRVSQIGIELELGDPIIDTLHDRYPDSNIESVDWPDPL